MVTYVLCEVRKVSAQLSSASHVSCRARHAAGPWQVLAEWLTDVKPKRRPVRGTRPQDHADHAACLPEGVSGLQPPTGPRGSRQHSV